MSGRIFELKPHAPKGDMMGRRITFLREAHSEIPEGGSFKDKRITAKGHTQALARRKLLGNPEEIDLIIVSPIPSTLQTAEVVVGGGRQNHVNKVFPLNELITRIGPVHDALERMRVRFESGKQDPNPLSAYYAGLQGDVRLMRLFGKNGWTAIYETIEANGAKNILVVGHSVYNVCMAHAYAPEKMVDMMNIPQIECGGFIVEMDHIGNFSNVIPLPKK